MSCLGIKLATVLKNRTLFESAIPSNFVVHVYKYNYVWLFQMSNGVTSVISHVEIVTVEDFFKGQKSSAEYLAASKSYVPPNTRTAILYVTPSKNDEEPGTACVSRFFCCESDCGLLDRFKVRQMQHMPQKALLQLA